MIHILQRDKYLSKRQTVHPKNGKEKIKQETNHKQVHGLNLANLTQINRRILKLYLPKSIKSMNAPCEQPPQVDGLRLPVLRTEKEMNFVEHILGA